MPAGAFKGKFRPLLFRIAGPVKGGPVNIKILNHIPGAGHALDQEKLKKIAVGQVAIHALGRKPLGIVAAVYGVLPGHPERFHNVAFGTKHIRVGGFDHETGGKHHHHGQHNTNN
jgi:hypothetical protein